MATAWIAGGSGLVGGLLLRTLLEGRRFERVVSIGRRTLPLEHAALVQVRTELVPEPQVGDVPAPGVAFCALGTTIRKAGSREAFRRVDHDAVVAFARAARTRGAKVFVHVTALGADPRSRVFYNAVKGEVERSAAALGFDAVYALRPSILDGPREESRPAERLGLAVARALGPVLGKYRPTKAEAVARAMNAVAERAQPGMHVVEAEEIARIAREGQA